MPYTFKDWQDAPSTATPISAASLEELEARVRGAMIVAPGTLGAAYTLNLLSDANVMLVGTLDSNTVITLSGMAAGAVFRLVLTQDATGGRSVTVTDGVGPAPVSINAVALSTTVIEGVCPDGATAVIWVH
jgi:hypothetical protein